MTSTAFKNRGCCAGGGRIGEVKQRHCWWTKAVEPEKLINESGAAQARRILKMRKPPHSNSKNDTLVLTAGWSTSSSSKKRGRKKTVSEQRQTARKGRWGRVLAC